MGKEQDLIQAAKSGNVAHIEKILGNKARKSGIQSFISRTVNPNYQDELGNTPLHYAALHGHRSSAELLLKYDASTNIPDNNGNYPLHLAAWNGNADVAKVLINTGPSRANVNEQNGTEDTALHSAAQFGFSLVVAVLLENHADPYIRNSRLESPLDLAAQYGRMETVKQLLTYYPTLLEDVNVVSAHTPLHLAAKNGHMNVVSYFLSCGMDVNLTCSTGTALHEAALFGKADVVNLLLQCGIDVTVVDSRNKTVLDLLASHPSTKAIEIRDLIYASSLKEPTSTLKRQFTEFPPSRKLHSGVLKTGSIPGYGVRPASAIYQRNLSYDNVPNPLPYYKDMDSKLLRRSGTYDTVPRSRESSLSQPSYDTVPPPKEATSPSFPVDWTIYDEAKDMCRSSNNKQSSVSVEGYALLGPAEEPSTGPPRLLTPEDIQGGYALLGYPVKDAGVSRPDSTYALVRPPGESSVPSRNLTPSQSAFDDYSRVGVPIGEGGEPTPMPTAKPQCPVWPGSGTYDGSKKESENFNHVKKFPGTQTTNEEGGERIPRSDVAGGDNSSYFFVEQPRKTQSSQPQLETYDFVQPQPRPVSSPQPSVYEVPPSLTLRGKGNGQEVSDTTPSRSSIGQSSDLYENTSILTPQRESLRKSDYDLVSFPARKATIEAPSYDVVPASSQVTQDKATLNRERNDSMSGLRTQSGSCPLVNAQGYEIVNLRQPATETNDSNPEMQPFACRPGYVPMAPPEDGYEKLSAPAEVQEQLRNYGGTYETLSMSGPQRKGSQTEPGSRNIPGAAPSYGVPLAGSPSVYEIAPPPRNVSVAAPPRPPRQSEPALRSQAEVQWIEKEQAQPQAPRRRQNDYSEWPAPGMVREPVSPVKSPKADPYEQVRIEGPDKKVPNTIDWERVRQVGTQRYGGEYCTLSPSSVGPNQTFNRESITSSERSSITEPVMTPPFSPPSPSTAGASVFEALGSLQSSDMPAIPETDKDVGDQNSAGEKRKAPIPKPRKRNSLKAGMPKVLPRSDSLNDKEADVAPEEIKRSTTLEEANQDPFSVRPSVENAEVSAKDDSLKSSDFVALHKSFSPFSSREDISTCVNASQNEREEPDGAETDSEVTPSPLIYENVLFKRSDTTENDAKKISSEGESDDARDASVGRPESYRLSTLSVDSPMDEREEWEKIEAFLSSIGQIEVPQTLEEQITQAGMADSVPGWLKALDLGQYESSMMANGFDDIHFLNGVIEDDDLLQIGIVDFSHRRTIMEALKFLPACPRLSDLDTTKPDSLKDWLELICLSEYFDVFYHNGFNSMERLHMLWEVELTSVLEVNSLGHRKRILASLKEDVKESEKEQPEVPNLEVSSAHIQEQLAELKMYFPDEKLAQPSVPTPPRRTSKDLVAAAEQMMANAKEQVAKKAAKERACKKWKHESTVLIKGSVNYTTLYLGSHAVKTITGLESTIDACRKMRLSTEKLQKIPSVILSVSVRGIKFIDARSKIMVSNHDMRNISYITQDPEDRRVFAYIAKDAKTDKHYCHVFKMDSSATSDEVTMTIGQAFELAFSQFVQAQSRRPKQ